MDILITSTGRIFRRMDDCTALALIEALPSVFERVKPAAPPAPVTTPRFYVAGSPHTGALGIFVQLPTGEVRSVFTEGITKKRAEDALGAGEMPDNVWEHFDSKRSVEMQRVASGTLRR
jgi:hypothetical protein